MIPQGPNIGKSRLDQTLLLDQQPTPEKYFLSPNIIPVQIVDCTPNTGFLPVITNYASQFKYQADVNPGTDDGPSLQAAVDGIYDLEVAVTTTIDSLTSWGVAVGSVVKIGGEFETVAGVLQRWKFAAWMQAGWEIRAISLAGFTGTQRASVQMIPRSL